MGPPAEGGRSPAPIDRPIIEFLQTSLHGTQQVERAAISDASGHLELRVDFASSYYPEHIQDATLSVRWYVNDDFKIHYQEEHPNTRWQCRWDRHPNSHNSRSHFHPPPNARTPGEDAAWPDDHRDVLRLILDEVADRITQLWEE